MRKINDLRTKIEFALAGSNRAVRSVIDNMSGAATTFPTPNGSDVTGFGARVISRCRVHDFGDVFRR
jgi:hypothetical protein